MGHKFNEETLRLAEAFKNEYSDGDTIDGVEMNKFFARQGLVMNGAPRRNDKRKQMNTALVKIHGMECRCTSPGNYEVVSGEKILSKQMIFSKRKVKSIATTQNKNIQARVNQLLDQPNLSDQARISAIFAEQAGEMMIAQAAVATKLLESAEAAQKIYLKSVEERKRLTE